SAELAAHVLGARPLDLADAWAELERAQVFRDGAFAHDLIHAAALASVPPPIARELHREIADYLGARNAAPARLAEHWLAAGDDRRALESLLRAAEGAFRQTLRLTEAARLYERAVEVAERLGDDDATFDALRGLCDVLTSLDRNRLDETLLSRLDAHARTPLRKARALAIRGHVMMQRGRHAEGLPFALRAADAARAAGDEELAVACLSDAAAAATLTGDSARAARILRSVLPWTLEHARDETKLNVFAHLAMCLDNMDQQAEALPLHRRAIDTALRLRRFDEAVVDHGNLAISLLDVGQASAALNTIREARQLGAAYDAVAGSAFLLNMLEGVACTTLRRYAAALQALDGALDDVAHNTLGRAAVRIHRANLWIHLGQFARAQRELTSIASEADLPSWLRARRQQMLGRCAWSVGRTTEAARHWHAASAQAPKHERAVLATMIALDCALVQPREEALAAVERVLARASSLGHEGSALAARIRLARLALQAGELDTALRALAETQQTSEEIEPNDLYRGELWLTAVVALRGAGRAEDAEGHLRQALGAVRRIAAEQVPPEFRDSFLNRNPVNRELLTLATRDRLGNL
ncbi:MAG: hypothetical protein N2688_14475, partial [Burkholderiaceae bacterium]|nr:hypothetical protein [Burkholderiaceae bacterium]